MLDAGAETDTQRLQFKRASMATADVKTIHCAHQLSASCDTRLRLEERPVSGGEEMMVSRLIVVVQDSSVAAAAETREIKVRQTE